MGEETNAFIEAIIAFFIFLGLLMGILNSEANEALKYFAVNILLLATVVIYIQMVLMKRIEKLEEKQ